jgi:hypothetical protein
LNSRLILINAVLAAIVVGAVVWFATSGGGPAEAPPPAAEAERKRDAAFDWVDPAKGLKIIMFYSTPATIARGEAAILCYGVANADQVTLDPPEVELTPVLNRCVEVKPTTTTTYTLTATNKRGEDQSQALEITVTGTRAARPSPTAAPDAGKDVRIAYFRKEETTKEDGLTVHKLCFRVWNADQVEVKPEAFPPSRVFQGCFGVAVHKETTYTLTARAKDGTEVSESLTVSP